jgi:hypothetical protein
VGVTDVAQLLAAVGGGTVLPSVAKAVWRRLTGSAAQARDETQIGRLTARVSELEELIDLLRRALDKHLIRESTVASLAELLIALLEQALGHFAVHGIEPPPGLLRNLDRARELLDRARLQIRQINEQPRGEG